MAEETDQGGRIEQVGTKMSPWTLDQSEAANWSTASATEKIRIFVQNYEESAKQSEVQSGVPRLVTLGQAALESGWGKHAPRFNFFGIKAKPSDPPESRQLLRTREVLNGPNHQFPEIISITPLPNGKFEYIVRDWFRAYSSAAEAFEAHGQLLRRPRYQEAFNHLDDPFKFAEKVAKAGYATDPEYFNILSSVMSRIENFLT